VDRPAGARTIDELLATVRGRIERVQPGEVPGAVVVDPNMPAAPPASPWRIPEMTGYDLEVILLCDQGYSSSLVADTLRALGVRRAVDVIGGFEAWAALGLPVVRPRRAA
jgi:rhodanese-related sulfurtransferase